MKNPDNAATLCALIPAFREERHIAAVVRGVLAQGLHPVVIDDASPDATSINAQAAGAIVLHHPLNRGKGAALRTGFRYAMEHGYSRVFTLDGDGQHDPTDVPAFCAAMREDPTAVLIGCRMSETSTMPLIRRLTNRFMSWLLSRMIGQRVPDTQCGFRSYPIASLPMILDGSARYEAESEVLIRLSRAGYRIVSVPVRTIYGDERSKINPFADTVRFFAMLLRLRRKRVFKRPVPSTTES